MTTLDDILDRNSQAAVDAARQAAAEERLADDRARRNRPSLSDLVRDLTSGPAFADVVFTVVRDLKRQWWVVHCTDRVAGPYGRRKTACRVSDREALMARDLPHFVRVTVANLLDALKDVPSP